jgi:hypothetical protein
MKQRTRRILFWLGVALVLLPTAFGVFTFFQPREYQSSVFIEVRQPGQPPPPAPPLIDRDTLFAILFLVGIYTPGVVLLLIVYFSRRKESKLHATPAI